MIEHERDYFRARSTPQASNSISNNHAGQPAKYREGQEVVPMETEDNS